MAEQAAGSEATGPTAPDNGSMTLLDAYLSCLVHDLKKVLLCGKRHGRPEGLEYAHW
ncbi:MAG: hypothetical protein GW802_38685, partial [Armatimonadetes bacterium]|nr:hypothetical protein [Armatimonadota bacterium]